MAEADEPSANSETAKSEKISDEDNPVIKKALNPKMEIVGEWQGFVLGGYDRSNLTVKKHPEQKDAYQLEFARKTDFSGVRRTTRTAKFVDGILTLNEPIEGFAISTPSYAKLYAVRSKGKDFLVPSVHVKELKQEEDLGSRTAYMLQPRDIRKKR